MRTRFLGLLTLVLALLLLTAWLHLRPEPPPAWTPAPNASAPLR